MSKPKFLQPEEIEDSIVRSAFDFQSQCANKTKTCISRKCLDCGEVEQVIVSDIRRRLKSKTKQRGLCRKCSIRGENSFFWKRGFSIDKSGYVRIIDHKHPKRDVNNQIFEHRVVMEQFLGRYLSASEQVHHINGIKADNRIENLELWQKNHPTGKRYADMTVQDLQTLLEEIESLIKFKKKGEENPPKKDKEKVNCYF